MINILVGEWKWTAQPSGHIFLLQSHHSALKTQNTPPSVTAISHLSMISHIYIPHLKIDPIQMFANGKEYSRSENSETAMIFFCCIISRSLIKCKQIRTKGQMLFLPSQHIRCSMEHFQMLDNMDYQVLQKLLETMSAWVQISNTKQFYFQM